MITYEFSHNHVVRFVNGHRNYAIIFRHHGCYYYDLMALDNGETIKYIPQKVLVSVGKLSEMKSCEKEKESKK